LFYKIRDFIMNIDPTSPYHSGHRSVLEKNVRPVQDAGMDGKVQNDAEDEWILVKKRKTKFSNGVTGKNADHEDGHSLK
jgi:glutamine synthetase